MYAYIFFSAEESAGIGKLKKSCILINYVLDLALMTVKHSQNVDVLRRYAVEIRQLANETILIDVAINKHGWVCGLCFSFVIIFCCRCGRKNGRIK